MAGTGTDDQYHVRETLLIVAALIAGVTFQAGVNPPGGVWQDDEKDGEGKLVHKAGCAVYASQSGAFYTFLAFNTLALSTSILLLMSLTRKSTFRFEVLVATLSMFATYASSIFAITPPDGSGYFRFLLFIAAAPFIVRLLVGTFKFICCCGKRIFKFICCCGKRSTTELQSERRIPS